jgi:hypothetical protein
MARQRFSISVRNTLARWLRTWAKRLAVDAPDVSDDAVAGQADGPPAHWLERANENQQPPAHWLAHIRARGRAQAQSPVHLKTPEPPDIGQPASTLPTTRTPEPVPPAADERKRTMPQSRSPLRLIPRTKPTQEETAEMAKVEEPPAQAKEPPTRKAKENVPEPVSLQKRQTQEKSRATMVRLEPRPKGEGIERTAAPSEESFPKSAAISLSSAPHNPEPRAQDERAEHKSSVEPDSWPLKDKDIAVSIPQQQPSPADLWRPADLWPHYPRPVPQPKPNQTPEGPETVQWVNLESEYAPAATHTSATPVAPPGHLPSPKVEQRLSEKTVGKDRPPAATLQPRSSSQGESHAWPQEWEEEKDRWPALPTGCMEEETASDTAENWEAHLRAWKRRQKLDREQRGILWNESPS